MWRSRAFFRQHAQGFLLQLARFGGANQAVVRHQIQHRIAPIFRPFRVAARVVIRSALDHADQQGDFLRAQLINRAAKIIARGQAEAVNRLVAVLAEIDLVQIAFKDFIFRIMPLHFERHNRFRSLAAERALGR